MENYLVNIDGKEISVVEAGDVENPDNLGSNGARMKDFNVRLNQRCAMALGVGLLVVTN